MSDERFEFVVASNRLPVDYVVDDDGSPGWRTSPGGLVTALEPVMRDAGGAWVGWGGQADLENFYEGFSNDTLWPLYHDVIAPPGFHRVWWDNYVSVNQRFANAVAAIAAQAATVWVHDYQLQLVPRM